MNACTATPQSTGFIGSMTRFIDCQAELLGSGAWAALSMPGSTLSIVLTGFLTIFIALIGYRLLLGENLTIRDGTIAMIKIGAVFALATSWPAYRTLVYDLVTDAPAQLVSEIARPSAVPGSDGTLVRRLDMADGALVQLAVLGTGNPIMAQEDVRIAPPPFAGFNAFAIGGSRILFLLTAVAGLGVIRIIAAMMLALGPFFIAFLLFDNTRSLFEGWVRVLAGAALGMIGVVIALGLQLALMEPWLSTVLSRRMAGEALPSIPTELLVVTSLFALIVVAVIIAAAALARAFRLAPILARAGISAAGERDVSTGSGARPVTRIAPSSDERSRAAAVADVLVAMQRREGAALPAPRPMIMAANGPSSLARDGEGAGRTAPVGRTMRRTARTRGSASAERRDRG